MGTFIYGYGNLNQRVMNAEKEIASVQQIQKVATEKMFEEQRKNLEQMSALNTKVAAVANDIEWIKRNIK